MNDLDDILAEAVEDAQEKVNVCADDDAIKRLCNRWLQMDFHITTSHKDWKHFDKIQANVEKTIKRYMQYTRCLSMDSACVVDFYMKEINHGWMRQNHLLLDVYWTGSFPRNSRECIYMLHDIAKLVFDCSGCNIRLISVFAKYPDEKWHVVSNTPEISTSYNMYTAMLKIIDGGEYFSETLALNDAVDGLYYLVTRMLKEEKRLCRESMQWMIDRTKLILQKTPLMNVINSNVCTMLRGTITKHQRTVTDMHTFLQDMQPAYPLTHRKMYIAPSLRKKKGMETVSLYPHDNKLYTHPKTLDEVDESLKQIHYQMFVEHIDELSVFGHMSIKDKGTETDLFSLSPLFHDNEMYWVAIIECHPCGQWQRQLALPHE
jgi:hypothetical protein